MQGCFVLIALVCCSSIVKLKLGGTEPIGYLTIAGKAWLDMDKVEVTVIQGKSEYMKKRILKAE